jgi:hypothetical protein
MTEVDGLSKKMMPGVLGTELFEAPNPVASCAEGNTVDDSGSAAFASTSALSIARQSALDERVSKIAILERPGFFYCRTSLSAHETRVLHRRPRMLHRRPRAPSKTESPLWIFENLPSPLGSQPFQNLNLI